jgi:long-chain acyl-CoA synthetase
MNICLNFESHQLSAPELTARARRAAAGFLTLGASEQRPVALVLRNDLAFFEAMTACRLAGICMVPVNWHLTAAELRYVLHDCAAKVVVVHADLLEQVLPVIGNNTEVLVVPTPASISRTYSLAAIPVDTAHRVWDDWIDQQTPFDGHADPVGSTMLYTSGTTGNPKGVRRAPLSADLHAAYFNAIARNFGLERDARVLITGPLYHSAPLGHANATLALNGQQWLMPRFDPQHLLELVETHRITHMHMVPTMFVRLLRLPQAIRERYDPSSIRCAIHGAAPCPVSVKKSMIEWWGPVIREYYGSTEASLLSAIDSDEWSQRPGSVGRALPGVCLQVRDPQGCALAAGVEGEIWGRLDIAPQFTYHGREQDRAAIERDGLLTNGDVGYLDEAGYLYICDRLRDMIISGGVNIYPAEIEGVLQSHPQVADCAVFGIPDEEFGESVAAAVQCVDGETIDKDSLRSFLREHLAPFKVPREFIFHDDLPRVDNGKIYKRRLREPYWVAAGRQI